MTLSASNELVIADFLARLPEETRADAEQAIRFAINTPGLWMTTADRQEMYARLLAGGIMEIAYCPKPGFMAMLTLT